MNEFKEALRVKQYTTKPIDYCFRIQQTPDAIQTAGSFVFAMLGNIDPVFTKTEHFKSVKAAKIFITGQSSAIKSYEAIHHNRAGFYFFFGCPPSEAELSALAARSIFHRTFYTVENVNQFLDTKLPNPGFVQSQYSDDTFKRNLIDGLRNSKHQLDILYSIGKG